MKKIYFVVFIALCAFILSACRSTRISSSTSSSSVISESSSGTESSSSSIIESSSSTSSSQSNESSVESSSVSHDSTESNVNGGEITNGVLNITEAYGTSETIVVKFDTLSGATYNAYYKLSADSTYTKVDSDLVRNNRVDIVGLYGNATYDVKIVPVYSGTESPTDASSAVCTTTAYDRSGYAHFNYTAGVGGYNDNGTPKSDAIIVYLTDANKDTLTIPGYESYGTGIGWILNNNQYGSPENTSTSTIEDKDNNPSTNWYSTGITPITQEHPVIIRVIGTVNNPAGTTAYDSTANGGSVNDNGCMARMKNAKNLTIEGIGADAKINGWGIHFMAVESTTYPGGTGFEVRNIIFDNYPEDALGMEGTQEDSTKIIKAPVERCWIHNNSFYPGYCANPAESDKAEGDGSCDFKRGRYFTLSYNYFEDCHKTNLVGSGDTSYQYCLTFHHNYWKNCGARMPLLRQANIHYYNNYIDSATDSAVSFRANSYMLSENNYFRNVKNPFTDANSGGKVKSFNDMFYAGSDDNNATIVTSRTQVVANSCSDIGAGVDYSAFDTSTSLFYYDAVNQKSDVEHMTSANDARIECMAYSGALKENPVNVTSSNLYSTNIPTNSVTLPYTISYSASVGGKTATLDNVIYNLTSDAASGSIKFRLQGVTFRISEECTFTMSSNSSNPAQLVSNNGTVYLRGSGTVVIPAGVYIIDTATNSASGVKDAYISSFSLDATNNPVQSLARIAAAQAAIDAIPATITYNSTVYSAILNAKSLYDELSSSEKDQLTNAIYISSSYTEYIAAGVTYVESAISAIGDVTESSGSAISSTRDKYNTFIAIFPDEMISNYQTLLDAEAAYESYAVLDVIDLIDALDTITLASEADLNEIATLYDSLSVDNKALVTNYADYLTAKATYDSLKAVADTIALIDAIGTVNASSGSAINAARSAYDALTTSEQADVTNYTTLTDAETAYQSYANATHEHSFTASGLTSDYFTIIGNLSTDKGSMTYESVTYTRCCKIEGSTNISFTCDTPSTLTLVLGASGVGFNGNIKIDGTKVAVTNGVLTMTLSFGTHTITKDTTTNLFYMRVVPN